MPQQILAIHGGDVFKTYEDYLKFLKDYKIDTIERAKRTKKWKDRLQENLGNDYEVFVPLMPCGYNAKYVEWKIWFEKFFPFLKDGIILIGGSLGGIFLAKYLSENDFPVKIKAVFLVAAPFDDKDRNADYTLEDFALPESLEKFADQAEKIFLYHSKNDSCVPFSDLAKYAQKLPEAEKVIFEDKDHFVQKEFPEIIEKIKSL